MIAGLILAAGESSRMGQDKALLAYRGSTFLEHIILTLREAGIDRIGVVLGHHAEEIKQRVNLEGIEATVNPAYPRGQTSSLQCGLRAFLHPELEAILLCLVDHPAVTPEVVRQLVKRFRETSAPVVIPTYQGQRGHPVLLGRVLFSELLELESGAGADAVVRKYRNQTAWVEVEDDGILMDIDNPENYRHMP